MTSGSWRPSRQAAKEQSGITDRVDPQVNAAPLDRGSFAGDQILNGGDMTAFAAAPDLNVDERKPELMYVARQRDGSDYRVGHIDRFLDEADNIAIIDRNKAQLAGLLQR